MDEGIAATQSSRILIWFDVPYWGLFRGRMYDIDGVDKHGRRYGINVHHNWKSWRSVPDRLSYQVHHGVYIQIFHVNAKAVPRVSWTPTNASKT